MLPGMYDSNVGIENHHNGINKKIAFHLTFHVVQRRILIFTIRAYLESIYPCINDVFVCFMCSLCVYVCDAYVCMYENVCLVEELLSGFYSITF